jgi:hypothetical protein
MQYFDVDSHSYSRVNVITRYNTFLSRLVSFQQQKVLTNFINNLVINVSYFAMPFFSYSNQMKRKHEEFNLIWLYYLLHIVIAIPHSCIHLCIQSLTLHSTVKLRFHLLGTQSNNVMMKVNITNNKKKERCIYYASIPQYNKSRTRQLNIKLNIN